MKKLSLIFLTLLVAFSCTKEHSKDYLTLSGKIDNNKDSIISIFGRSGLLKTIKINNDGSFKDTLNVDKGEIYTLQTSQTKRVPIFLKNGFNLSINADDSKDDIMSDLKISGEGSSNTNFIVAQINKSRNLGNPQLILNLEKEAFDKKLASIKGEYDSILNSYANIDSSIVEMANQQTKQLVNYFESTYSNNLTMGRGKPSPKFEEYVDFSGGKKSLDSFKGKYVYIDVWATWCGPCIREIPSLKKLEKEYHNKNIEFISISTDEARRNGNSWEAAEKKWRNFVKEKELSGVQLWSGQDYSFQRAYQINGIPRFILVDPQGNIVEANAPRPSDPRLKTLFTSLGL
ncbi:TlpA family protein disulfide reductase [Polaribacter pectinis]|uniref:TlpA family protein disulfide reductase n=1 Tax=Polaribacter pectinis TaxID=2738844 RepID=A0A7G9LBG9_9FLAO|nr:TlpA disulfide reductase family protein [Polaribacter pectinis]QNM85968.1 TlpA family protein disulfide reductase [Polaribacter pectinis]